MIRRKFLIGMLTTSAVMLTKNAWAFEMLGSKRKNFPFQLTDKQWRERLTEEQYKILRSEGTEQSCSSPLNEYTEAGDYHCVGCGHLLFSDATKFKSSSGWPSFYEPVDEYAIGTKTDFKLGVPRTEVHCSNCGGHLGHVFKDGPPPTGLRYCINGVAMSFSPRES